MMDVTEQRAPCRRVTRMPVLVGHLAPAPVIQTCEIASSNLPHLTQAGTECSV